MVRRLPWLSSRNTTVPPARHVSLLSQQSSQPDEPPPKRRRVLPPNIAGRSSSSSPPPVLSPALDQQRTPSTSPPPTVQHDHELMAKDGQDDVWRMVEDEFLTTAQLFTQHLHHAEYMRLKKLAQTRSPATLRAIQRHVDGETVRNPQVSLHEMQSNRAEKLRKVVDEGVIKDEGSGDEELEWIRDHNLAGLMGSPKSKRKARADLTSLVGPVQRITKAAFGYKGQRYPCEDEVAGDIEDDQSTDAIEDVHKAENDLDYDDLDLDLDLDTPGSRAQPPSHVEICGSSPSIRPIQDPREVSEEHCMNSGIHATTNQAPIQFSSDNSIPCKLAHSHSPRRQTVSCSWRRKIGRGVGITKNDSHLIKAEEIPTFLV